VTILAMSDLSTLCFVDACEECRDPDCLCHCHDCDDLEPLFDESEPVTWLSADDGVRLREATR